MATYTDLLRHIPAETFASLLQDCGRKAREALFARHNVRVAKGPKTSVLQSGKHELRTAKLFEVLQHTDDEPLSEELLRQLFLRHRALLATALDAIGVPHEDGLTNADELSRFADMSDDAANQLVDQVVASKVEGSDIAPLYVSFMRAQMVAAKSEQ